MKQDPLDELQGFYEHCRVAPVPDRLLAQTVLVPLWKRSLIPFAGLSFGGFVALLILTLPTHPSQELGAEAARALSQSQIRTRPELRVTEHAQQRSNKPWTA